MTAWILDHPLIFATIVIVLIFALAMRFDGRMAREIDKYLTENNDELNG